MRNAFKTTTVGIGSFVRLLAALTVIAGVLLLISSCAEKGEDASELALKLRAELLEAEKLVIGADIAADYGDRVYEFSIKYTGDGSAGQISIVSPEQLAGITAEVSPDGCALVYDGATLDTGDLTTGGLSPAGALPLLISQWQSGHIDYCGFERYGDAETVVMTTAIDETAAQKTWFDAATQLPLRSEISESGKMVIACEFSNVVLE